MTILSEPPPMVAFYTIGTTKVDVYAINGILAVRTGAALNAIKDISVDAAIDFAERIQIAYIDNSGSFVELQLVNGFLKNP